MDDQTPAPHPERRPIAKSENPASSGPARPDPADSSSSTQGADRLTVLAHELANLLDGSLRSLSLAKRSLDDPETTTPTPDDPRKRLDVVRTSLVRMAELIDAAMARPGPGGSLIPHATADIELGEAIFHAVDVLSPMASEHGVRITTLVSNGLSGVPAGTIYPVLVNALTNAIESIANAASQGGPGGGLIEVEAGWTEDGRIQFVVRDDGMGVPEDSAAKCFRFGYSSKPQGTGLGLAVARAIVDDLPDGSVRLATRRDLPPGLRPGATFEVSFRPSDATGSNSSASGAA